LASSTIVRRATFHAPFTLRSTSSRQPEELVIRLQVRAVHEKRGLDPYLTVLLGGRLEILDQVTTTALALHGRGLCCRQRTRGVET
jgi:hypothetical protein